MAVEIYDALWLADPDETTYPHAPTQALVDLNPVGCDTSAYGFVLMDAEAPNLEAPRRSVSLGVVTRDGDQVAAQSHGNAPLRYRIGYKGDPAGDVTQIVDDLRALATALRRSRVLAWQIAGEAEPLFYDFSGYRIPHYLRGQRRGLYQAARKLIDSDGFALEFDAYPWPRPARVDGAPVDLDNDVGNQEMLVTNLGNQTGETRTTITPNAGAALAWLALGIRSKGDLTEFRSLYARGSADWVLKRDTAIEAVAGASGGDAASTDFTTETRERRFRDNRDVTDPTAVEGTFHAFLRCKAHGGTPGTSEFEVQLKHGFAVTEIAQEVGPRLSMDWRNVDTPEWIWFDLGDIQVPAGVGRLVFDLYAARLSGDQEMAWDQIVLVPADEYLSIGGVPGYRMGKWGRILYEPDELLGTGTLRQGTYRLNDENELAHTPATDLVAGIYEARIDAGLFEPDDGDIEDGPNPTAKELGRLRVVADPAGTADVRATLVLRNQKNRRETTRKKRLYFEVTNADVIAGTEFWVEVEQTATQLTGRAIRIKRLRLSYMPTITADDALVLESSVTPLLQTAHVESATVTAFSFPLENEPPWAPPDDSVWVALWGDAPVDQGFGDIDERGPVPRAILLRSCSVQVDVTERVSH